MVSDGDRKVIFGHEIEHNLRVDDGVWRVDWLLEESSHRQVFSACEEGIQSGEPGANTLDFVVEAFQLVVVGLSKVIHLDLKHWTHSSWMGSLLRRKYAKEAECSYLRVLCTGL